MTSTSGPSRRAAAVSASTVSRLGQLRANRMTPPSPDCSASAARSSGIAVPPRPPANYTAAARAGSLVFAAGQLASDFKEGVAAEARLDPAFPYYGSAIKKQTRYVLENLAQTFKAAGTSLDHVVKAQVFHTDLMNFSAFDEVWKEFFLTPPPRTTIGTTGLLVPGTLVEIDLIATMPQAPGRVIKSDGPRPLAVY